MRTLFSVLCTLTLASSLAHSATPVVVTKSNQTGLGIEFTLKSAPVSNTPESIRITCIMQRTNSLESLRAVELYSGAKPTTSHTLLLRRKADLSILLWRHTSNTTQEKVVTEFILPRELIKQAYICLHVINKRTVYSMPTGKKMSMDEHSAYAIKLSTYPSPALKRTIKHEHQDEQIDIDITL